MLMRKAEWNLVTHFRGAAWLAEQGVH